MRIHIAIEHRTELVEQLRKLGAEHITMEVPEIPANYVISSDIAKKTEILFCEIPPQNIGEMERLKLVQVSSTGYSQLFDLGLSERGVRACNGRGELTAPSPSGRWRCW